MRQSSVPFWHCQLYRSIISLAIARVEYVYYVCMYICEGVGLEGVKLIYVSLFAWNTNICMHFETELDPFNFDRFSSLVSFDADAVPAVDHTRWTFNHHALDMLIWLLFLLSSLWCRWAVFVLSVLVMMEALVEGCCLCCVIVLRLLEVGVDGGWRNVIRAVLIVCKYLLATISNFSVVREPSPVLFSFRPTLSCSN